MFVGIFYKNKHVNKKEKVMKYSSKDKESIKEYARKLLNTSLRSRRYVRIETLFRGDACVTKYS